MNATRHRRIYIIYEKDDRAMEYTSINWMMRKKAMVETKITAISKKTFVPDMVKGFGSIKLDYFVFNIYLSIGSTSHGSDVISFPAQGSHAHANSSASAGCGKMCSLVLLWSLKVIHCRPLDLLLSILPWNTKHSLFSANPVARETGGSFSDC